jgi:energy-coupling factor transporter ATP-binding protein EcfA2
MKSHLVLHSKTQQGLIAFQTYPGHAILVLGPTGSGKAALSHHLAANLLETSTESLDSYAYLKIIGPIADKTIGIETIRDLESFLRLKVPGDKLVDRIVIIEDAQTLTTESQNALLKTLEEPPASTVLILTSNSEQALLPTLRSRMQTLNLVKPTKYQLEDYFAAGGFNSSKIDQSYAISGGLPGLMQALLSDSAHPLSEATKLAREILQGTAYERLLLVDSLSKQRSLAENVCFILQQMAHISLQSASQDSSLRWQTILTSSYEAAQSLANSTQPKLVLTNLMLNLS